MINYYLRENLDETYTGILIFQYFRKHVLQFILIPMESQLHPDSGDTRCIFPEPSKWKNKMSQADDQDIYVLVGT